MTAKEARELTNEHINNVNNQQYESIIIKIKSSILRGGNRCFYYSDLETKVKKKLKNDGFTIVSTNHRNETTVIISW